MSRNKQNVMGKVYLNTGEFKVVCYRFSMVLELWLMIYIVGYITIFLLYRNKAGSITSPKSMELAWWQKTVLPQRFCKSWASLVSREVSKIFQ